MVKMIEALFDGTVFHPTEPIALAPNTRVRMMGARKSKGASGICWSIRWAWCWLSSLPVRVSTMGWRLRSCSATSRPRTFPVS